MKAIGIKIVDLQPMYAGEAQYKGYKTNDKEGNDEGYEITYPDGYKSWCPKDIVDNAYFKLDEKNDGTSITMDDVTRFVPSYKATTLGKKTTVLYAKTITGFELIENSACVDPKNYSQKLGEQYAMEKVHSKIWDYLGFVLQWAKNGLNKE